MDQRAQFRVLGEQNPRLEHRHERWVRMDQTILVLTDGQPRAYLKASLQLQAGLWQTAAWYRRLAAR